MRILYIVHQFYPEFSGGTERVTLNIARSMQSAGHYVHILTAEVQNESKPNYDSKVVDFSKVSVYHGIPITKIPRSVMNADCEIAFDPETFISDMAKKWIRGLRFELVHFMHTMRMSSLMLATMELGTPYIVTCTDFYLPCYRVNMLDKANSSCKTPDGGASCRAKCLVSPWTDDTLKLRYDVSRRFLERAACRVAPSHFVRRKMEDAYPGLEFKVLAHGVEILSQSRDIEETEIQIPTMKKARIRFGYVGSIIAHKGLDTAIEAFQGTDGDCLEFAVIGGFYGDKAFREKIMSMAAMDQRITILGELPPGDIKGQMSKIDVLCLPSKVPESYSMVLHEAMALGVPAIVSDLGAPSEHIRESGAGVSVSAFDTQEWRKVLQTLADNPQVIEQWRSKTTMPYSTEEESAIYESIYLTVSEGARE